MIYGLKDKIIDDICSIFFKFHDVEKVILYGSRAKGNFKNGSDIDLTLVGENLNLSISNKIELEIDNLLLPYSFDISIYHQISNVDLIEHIQRVGKIFYQKVNTN
jgi:uncharacterized protein